MFREFRAFISRGNVLGLAVGVVMGLAFGAVVASFVKDILMPPIGLALGQVDFSNLFVSLDGQRYASLAEAQRVGAPTLNYGQFINSIINFLLVAFGIYLIVKLVNKSLLTPTRPCPHCQSLISSAATRCPQCTSEL